MPGLFWTFMADIGSDPWIERVSSAANLSDEISRDKYELADRHGWYGINLDLTDIHELMAPAAVDMEWAYTHAASHMADITVPQVREQLRRCFWAADTQWHQPVSP